MEFVSTLERHIHTSAKVSQDRYGLLLAFGALASNAQPKVQHRVAVFLISLQNTLEPTNGTDTSALIQVILAMGNTGSLYVVNDILNWIECPIVEVQLASIRALLKFTHLDSVIDRLTDILDTGLNEETIILVTHTLLKGHRYAEDLDIEISQETYHSVIQHLSAAVSRYDNTDLIVLVATYVQETVGALNSNVTDGFQVRYRKATSDWDSSSSSNYNLVASLSSRQSDVNNYTRHTAYLYGKTFGISKANLKVAAGLFFGLTEDCEDMKGRANFYAEGNVLSRKKTLADIDVSLEKSGTVLQGRMYAEIGDNNLLNYPLGPLSTYNQCLSYSTPLSRSQYRLFGFTYSIFVYVGTVDVSIHLYLGFRVDFDCQVCASALANDSYDLATASGGAGIVPQTNFTIAGSASVTLLV